MLAIANSLAQEFDRNLLQLPWSAKLIQSPQRKQLLAYIEMIVRWNKVYNLTAVREPSEMLTHHLMDSMVAAHAMAASVASPQTPKLVVDVGSGAGLPGVVMAIMYPHWIVHCVDTVQKKTSFIEQVRAELAVPNLFAHHKRIESFQPPDQHQTVDLITCRAFADLGQFIRGCGHLITDSTLLMAMKGRLALTEQELQLAGPVMADHGLCLCDTTALKVPGLEGERHLVIIGARR